ncbi:MAG TPA: NADH-quinone oxidoreductase subunit C [Candidatus Acidoferrales bacterium]
MESQELDKNPAVRKLRDSMPRAIAEVIESKGETTIVVPADELLRISEYLATDPALLFSFLSDISAVDRFPLEPRFEVNYHLVSLEKQVRLRLKVRLPGRDPAVHSVTPVWPTANWHERETFDLFGIRFDGHPDLRRILMPDEWEGYPLRKDYPVTGFR